MNEMRKLMEMVSLDENKIRSFEGSIDEELLNDMILQVMGKYDVSTDYFDRVKNDVIDDYTDSDISQVTEHDIVEIIDASGIPMAESLGEEVEQIQEDPTVGGNMADLQRKLTDVVSYAEELYWNYEKYPQLKEHQNLVQEIQTECDRLRRKVFEVR